MWIQRLVGDRELAAKRLDLRHELVLHDERRASECSTMYWISGVTSRKLIGTATSPALASAM